MKAKALRMSALLVWCVVCGLLFAMPTMSAIALEVPSGAQEVRIPVTLPVTEAIAGGEIEFSQTGGLRYVRFEPADGVKNPVGARVNDKTYVGFFSSGNEYQPVGGVLLMGDLVFDYPGNASEQVTLSMIKLHTKVDTGTGVNTQVINPNTVVPVSRLADAPGNGGSDDDGSSSDGGSGDNGSSDSSGNNGSSGTNGSTGTGTGTGSNGGTGSTGNGGTTGTGSTGTGSTGGTGASGTTSRSTDVRGTDGAVLDASGTGISDNAVASSATSGTTLSNEGPGGVGINDSATPQASPLSNSSVWSVWLVLALIAAAVALALLFLFWRRRRQQQAMELEEGFGRHHRNDPDEQ